MHYIKLTLGSPAGKGLTSCLLFVVFICVFVTFPCGILGQVWYLIVSMVLRPAIYEKIHKKRDRRTDGRTDGQSDDGPTLVQI